MTSMRRRLEEALSGKYADEIATQIQIAIIVDALKLGITSCYIRRTRFGELQCDMTPKALPENLFKSRCKQCVNEMKAKLREEGYL